MVVDIDSNEVMCEVQGHRSKVKVTMSKMKCDFPIFCIFYLGIKVKGDTGQGQRLHWPGKAGGLTSTSSCFIKLGVLFLTQERLKKITRDHKLELESLQPEQMERRNEIQNDLTNVKDGESY